MRVRRVKIVSLTQRARTFTLGDMDITEAKQGPLKVKSDTDVKSLASAVAMAAYEGRETTLRAIGAGAVNTAIKAAAIARGFTAARGIDLAIIPGFANIEGQSGEIVSAVVLRTIVL